MVPSLRIVSPMVARGVDTGNGAGEDKRDIKTCIGRKHSQVVPSMDVSPIAVGASVHRTVETDTCVTNTHVHGDYHHNVRPGGRCDEMR